MVMTLSKFLLDLKTFAADSIFMLEQKYLHKGISTNDVSGAKTWKLYNGSKMNWWNNMLIAVDSLLKEF